MLDELFAAPYEELHRLAISAKRSRINPVGGRVRIRVAFQNLPLREISGLPPTIPP
jgi:hypothetical protein